MTPSPDFIKQRQNPQSGIMELSSYMEVEEGTNFRDYWLLLRRYRWLILACVVAVASIVMLYTFTRTPIYTAHATLLIERKPPQVLKIQDALSESIDYAEFYKTQYEILKSRTLAERVLKAQEMDKKPNFASQESAGKTGFIAGLLQQFSEKSRKPDIPVTGPYAGSVDAYLSMLKIQPVRGTALVQVIFSTPDPALSAQLANVHSAAYVRYGLDLRSRTNDEALAFLEKKLMELKERVQNSEAALNSYRRDKGIISLSDKENIVVDRLADLNKRLTEAEAERIHLEAKVRTIRTGNYNVLPGIATDPVVQNIKTELAKLEAEQIQLAREFKPGYPPLDKVNAQIDNSRRRLRAELQNEIKTIESAYQAARTKESQLGAAMQEQKTATLNLKDSAVQYAILAREVDTNKQLYDGVLQRMREMGVAAESVSTNIYVVDKAELPGGPSYPNKTRSLLHALFFGLAGGIGLAFLMERWDGTFRTPEDLECYLRLPHLGIVPDFRFLNGKAHGYVSSYGQIAGASGRTKSDNGQLATRPIGNLLIIESVVSEAYRTLRSALLLARAGEPARTILLASAARGEGKTTSLINTAIIFAQMGGRVLVVDGDLRRPRCHRLLKVEKYAGLAEILAGQIAPLSAIKATKVENLFVITGGATPPNPAELLASQRMSEVLKDLQEQFDYIFIDSSPVLSVSDAVHVATMVNGVLLVVDGEKTPRQVVKRARLRLTHSRIKILGVLLNRVNIQEGHYAGYYRDYYKYYDGEGQEEERA